MAKLLDVVPDPYGNTHCQIEFLVERKFGRGAVWPKQTDEKERQAYRDDLDRMSLITTRQFWDLVEVETRLAEAEDKAKRRDYGIAINKRGRPRNTADPEVAAQDEAIARTVHRLTLWGFNLRRQVLPVVRRLAPQILPITQRSGRRVLGTDRIEQILEEFFDPVNGNGHWPSRNSEFTKAWRVSQRPPGTIISLATTLLQNSGHWPEDELLLKRGCTWPAPERTPKAQKRMEERAAFFRFRKRTVPRG